MQHLDFLGDLLVVFFVGGLVIYAVRPLKLPPIIGLLVAGALLGPHGLSLVSNAERVEGLAELGVVLLLFTIGIEFSLASLLGMWKVVLGAGGAQVVLTIAGGATAAMWFVDDWRKGVFFGFLAALSSTAIVLRLLGQRGELGTPQGRVALGILLFQDLCVVPLVLLAPLLAGAEGASAGVGKTLLLAVAVVVGVVVAARTIVPMVLERVVRARSRELFLTLLVVLCLGTAWLTSLAGLSLALGAFLAGLAVSESEYAHQALAESIPFRDAFGSLFFVSIGMLLDVRFLVDNVLVVAAITLGVIVIKTIAAGLPTLLLGYPLRVAAVVGFGLAQVGEFSFVLSHAGRELGLLTAPQYQALLAATVVTMMLTPGLLWVGDTAGRRLGAKRFVPWGAVEQAPSEHVLPEDHVIVVGYGVNGHNVCRALRATSIPYVVLELNPETVRAAREAGEPIYYGDSTRAAMLEHLGINRARVLVCAISDAAATRQTTSIARAANPKVHIIVRTRFVAEVEELRRLGADEVIPEEFETSVEIFSRALDQFSVPRNVVLDFVGQLREGTYEMLRNPTMLVERRSSDGLVLPGVEVQTVRVRSDAPAVGRSLGDLDLRSKTGATVAAVYRGGKTLGSPGADFRFEENDVIVVIGDHRQLDEALVTLSSSPQSSRSPG